MTNEGTVPAATQHLIWETAACTPKAKRMISFVRPIAGILLPTLLIGCGKAPAGTSDLRSVAQAKKACAGHSTIIAPKSDGPPVGKNSDFTKCMLEQANKVIGSREFEQICNAIPGARSDSEDGQCFIVHF